MYKISVVIPTLNRFALLAETIDNVESQTLAREHYEVIVVDNNSSDDTLRVLEEKSNLYPNLRYSSQRKPGAAAARNLGLGMANGEIVLFIDDDIEAESGLLESHLACQLENPRSAIIGTILSCWETTRDPFLRYLRDRGIFNPYSLAGGVMDFTCYHTGNVSTPRGILETAGGFDGQFSGYGMEDIELGYRLEKNGCRMLHSQGARGLHHYSPTYGQFTERCEQAGYSLGLMLRKHPELRTRFTENGPLPRVLKPFHRLYSFAGPLIRPLHRSLARWEEKRGTGPVTEVLGFHYNWALRYHFFLGYSRYAANGRSTSKLVAPIATEELKIEKQTSEVQNTSLVP